MKANDKDQPELWRDAVDEALPPDFAQESLARMLGGARSRRQRKLAVKAGVGAALVLPVLMMMMHREAKNESGPVPSVPPIAETGPVVEPLHPQVGTPRPAAPKAAVVETIGDEELLAAFGDRSVVLVGTGDAKQLVLLDGKKTR